MFGFSFFAEGGSGKLELKIFFFVGSVLIYRIYIEKLMVSFKTFRVFNSWALGFLAQNDIRSRFVEKDKEAIGSLFKGVKSFFNFDSFCFVWVVSVFFIAVILSVLFIDFDYHFFDAFKIKPGYVYFLSVFSDTVKSSFGFKILFDILSVLYLRIYLEIAVISLRKLQLSEIGLREYAVVGQLN